MCVYVYFVQPMYTKNGKGGRPSESDLSDLGTVEWNDPSEDVAKQVRGQRKSWANQVLRHLK